MPYQCFQEARKVLALDREEKLAQIAEMRARIVKVSNVPAERMGGEYVKKGKLVRMQKWLEELKVFADVNDPVIKKRFEDGIGKLLRFPSPLSEGMDTNTRCTKAIWTALSTGTLPARSGIPTNVPF